MGYHLHLESKQNNDTNELIQETETDSNLKKKLMVTKGEMLRGGINQEFEINIYTLVYIRQIISKDLIYSTGHSAQYSVISHMGKISKKEWLYA